MIGVVLVNYNNKKDTVECIWSIYNTVDVDLPFIIVVDNNSKVKISENELSFYPKLKLIVSDENLGFGRANNLAVNWLTNNLFTEFIFILNNDTIIEPKTISLLLKNFPSDADTVMVTPKILTYENEPRIWYGGGFFNFNRISANIRGLSMPNVPLANQFVEFASGCAMLIKSTYLKHTPPFDEFFFMYDEDVELCIRIKKDGGKIYYIDQSIVYHKGQGSQTGNKSKLLNQLSPKYSNLIFYLKLTIPNRYYIINKHVNGFRKNTLKLRLTLYWVAKSFQYLLSGNFQAFKITLKLLIKGLLVGTLH